MTPGLRLQDGVPDLFAGRYRIESLAGTGSSSVVYVAADTVSGKEVALKVLDPRLSWDPAALARLRREALVSRRVLHPGVVRVHDLVTDGRFSALVLERVEGESLASLILREAPLPLPRVAALGRGIAEVLAACHEKGVYHRDLKPTNVLVEPEGRVRLIDFGIARVSLMTTVTHTGAMLGTPGYQAPELLRGERTDHRADLYGLGLVLYALLTGRPAFAERDDLSAFRQLHASPPDPAELRPDTPQGLSRLVVSLLHAQPEHRPGDAWEVMAALADLPSGTPDRLPGIDCRDCGQRSRTAIPFCPRCGLYKRIPVRAGECFVRILSVDRSVEYELHLAHLFGPALRPRLLPRLGRGRAASAVLARGISRETALALAADARRFGGACEVGQGLGWLQMREAVTDGILALGLVGTVLGIWVIGRVTSTGGLEGGQVTAYRSLVVLFTAGMGTCLLAGSARPLLSFAGLPGRRARSAASGPDGPLAERVVAASRWPLAPELAGAVDACWGLKAALGEVAGHAPGDPTVALASAVDGALERLFQVAARAAEVAEALDARGVADVALDLARVQARRRAAGEAGGALARSEAATREELRVHEEADERLAVAASRLVLGAALFRRMSQALAEAGLAARRERELEDFLAHADLDLEALEQVLCAVRPLAAVAPTPGGLDAQATTSVPFP